MKERFKDHVALVTGGADGLGKGIAQRLGQEGATVVVVDVNEELMKSTQAEFEKSGIKSHFHPLDISDEGSVESAIKQVVSKHGKLDSVINCAGIVGPTSTNVADYDTQAFDKVYSINLKGSFLITKYAVQAMLPQNYGRILLIASIAGKEGNAGMSGYSVSKAGVIGLVKTAGKEYAETGITINGLAPSVIHTSMVDQCTPEQIKYMTDKIPMKRTGTIDEVAGLACWIVSKECSFTTGFTFDLSGGRATY